MTMLYKNSLARMYGAPGSGKSFVAMDMALSLAAGKFFIGHRLEKVPVVYVMAEGQAVNADRAEAWMTKHSVSDDDVEDTFFAVPDAIQLTETGVKPFIEVIRPVQPALVILDTKNAMMVGEENSASDFAVMRRAMDMIRKTSECCVMLVDHTGYEGTRARGSSAATAGMDTEIRIEKDDSSRPSLITAEVTRDKAAESGSKWSWHLIPEHPAAVLVPTEVPVDEHPTGPPDWATDARPLPAAIEQADLSVLMLEDVKALARYARMTDGPNGFRRTDATSALGYVRGTALGRTPAAVRDGVRRAWDWLENKGYLESVHPDPTPDQRRAGPSIWNSVR